MEIIKLYVDNGTFIPECCGDNLKTALKHLDLDEIKTLTVIKYAGYYFRVCQDNIVRFVTRGCDRYTIINKIVADVLSYHSPDHDLHQMGDRPVKPRCLGLHRM